MNLYNACQELGQNHASHGSLSEGLEYFLQAQQVAESFPQLNLVPDDASYSPYDHAVGSPCSSD